MSLSNKFSEGSGAAGLETALGEALLWTIGAPGKRGICCGPAR